MAIQSQKQHVSLVLAINRDGVKPGIHCTVFEVMRGSWVGRVFHSNSHCMSKSRRKTKIHDICAHIVRSDGQATT